MRQADMERFLVQDQQDLIALLELRFGPVPNDVHEQIVRIQELDTLQRLIIAGCNAADWEVFMEELKAGEGTFKVTGERFNPMAGGAGKGVSL